jgi:hypothetical protein
MYAVSVLYLKKALMFAWILNDPSAETYYYEKLGIDFFNIGDITKSSRYQNRGFYNVLESCTTLNYRFA